MLNCPENYLAVIVWIYLCVINKHNPSNELFTFVVFWDNRFEPRKWPEIETQNLRLASIYQSL